MKTFTLSFLALFALVFLSSCEDDDDQNLTTTELMVPDTYSFFRDGASTVSFEDQTTGIAMAEELVSAMLAPSTSLDQLNDLFQNPAGVDPFSTAELNESTVSVRSEVAASRDLFGDDATRAAEIKADFDGWLEAQATEMFPNWNEVASPGQPGQIAEGSTPRYINAWGLEYDQAVGKGLIGALMLDQINNNYLSPAVLDAGTARADNDAGITEPDQPYTYMEHRWDEAFGYLFGASASPATPLDDLRTADNFMNKYLGRMENDADYAGIAGEIEEAFRTGRQAIVEGDYEARDAAAEVIKANLEKVIAVRVVFYLMQAELNYRSQPAQLGAAFHDLSECWGFIYSLRFFNGGFTDYHALSEQYLVRLRNAAGDGFWDIELSELTTMAEEIAALTGITVAEAGS